MVVFLVVSLVAVALWAYAIGTVMEKAGYGRWFWIGIVPALGVLGVVVLAFVEWPVQRENRELRARLDALEAAARVS